MLHNASDVKELIPHFFLPSPDFLTLPYAARAQPLSSCMPALLWLGMELHLTDTCLCFPLLHYQAAQRRDCCTAVLPRVRALCPAAALGCREGLNLGLRQSGAPVGNVELPPW